jgi:hypothetical protein
MNYVYKFLGDNDEVLYVGKTINLNKRMRDHFISQRDYYASDVKKVQYKEYNYQNEMSIYEIYFISKYKPKYNLEFNYGEPLTCVIECTKEWTDFDLESLKTRKRKINNEKLSDLAEEYIEISNHIFTDNNLNNLNGLDLMVVLLFLKDNSNRWFTRTDIETFIGQGASKKTISNSLHKLLELKILILDNSSPKKLNGQYSYRLKSNRKQSETKIIINRNIFPYVQNKTISLKDLKIYLIIANKIKIQGFCTSKDIEDITKVKGTLDYIYNLQHANLIKIYKKEKDTKNFYEII